MKGFLIRLPIISAVAVIIAAIYGEGFVLLSIPLALAGFIVGWLLRWVLIHIMGATTNDWRDKIAMILLPLLAATIAAGAAGSF